jgi:hypothetical protein
VVSLIPALPGVPVSLTPSTPFLVFQGLSYPHRPCWYHLDPCRPPACCWLHFPNTCHTHITHCAYGRAQNMGLRATDPCPTAGPGQAPTLILRMTDSRREGLGLPGGGTDLPVPTVDFWSQPHVREGNSILVKPLLRN